MTTNRTSDAAGLAEAPDDGTIEVAGQRYSTPAGLARLLGVSLRTLARWDERRQGPPKIKVGKLVLYDLGKLHAWLESHERAPAAARGSNRRADA
jgi:phage terminase Nu1 subunit (DNA packaging protein)